MTARSLRPVLPHVILRDLGELSACVECAKIQIGWWILGLPRPAQVCSHGRVEQAHGRAAPPAAAVPRRRARPWEQSADAELDALEGVL